MEMKKIGFVDYYLGEWHAKHYPAMINAADRGFCVAYAYGELEVSPADGMTTDEFCKKYGAERCNTIAELCEKSDYIMILSPDNPETHLKYAKEVFPFGKPCNIDKTFAPDSKTAAEIFALAEKYGVKMFSSSSLRFANELKTIKRDAASLNIIGSGNFDNYIIHFAEIAFAVMGADVRSVMSVGTAKNAALSLAYNDGRTALINILCASGAPSFCISVEPGDGSKSDYIRIGGGYFDNLVAAILDMFDGGDAPVKPEETLTLMKFIDAAKRAVREPYKEILL